VAGVAHAQDDDAQIGVAGQPLDLGPKELRGPEKQLALDVHDGDGRVLARGLGAGGGEVPLRGEGVFDQFGPGRLAQVKHDRQPDPDEDGDLQRQEQGGEQGDKQGGGVRAGGAQADADLARS
jgi:hypothetical protein